jgi:hypothetical protein
MARKAASVVREKARCPMAAGHAGISARDVARREWFEPVDQVRRLVLGLAAMEHGRRRWRFLNREARLLVTALERISCVLTAKALQGGKHRGDDSG